MELLVEASFSYLIVLMMMVAFGGLIIWPTLLGLEPRVLTLFSFRLSIYHFLDTSWSPYMTPTCLLENKYFIHEYMVDRAVVNQ